MKKYNASDYDLVQNRVQKFYQDVPNGSIRTELVLSASTENLAVFKATIYEGEFLRSTGWASEVRDLELKTANSGKQYETVNFTSHLENAESSAVGRALANAGRHGNKRASREEMEAVQREQDRYTRACQAIDQKFEGVTDPASFESIANALRNNPRWDSQYDSYLQSKYTQLTQAEK